MIVYMNDVNSLAVEKTLLDDLALAAYRDQGKAEAEVEEGQETYKVEITVTPVRQ